ncbi:L-lactate dehydrogenase B chain [Selaginella moellendorffii]|nr:L-lactate dehydrogenase B chain [Selaginella moellendorffii]|eukprot:XP_002993299.2 L-lactate dehydrogenase B chain [Selaginella moellendorffii]
MGRQQQEVWHFFKPVPGGMAVADIVQRDVTKVTVVGVGNVGMACATSILSKRLCRSLVLIDVMGDKLKGEMMDLQHAAAFNPNVDICASTDYANTRNSQICIITAGAKQKSHDESRLALVQSNVELLRKIIPELLKYSPDTLLLVVSNPVDILTYVSWKISGLPASRVLGSGTNLDSSRFRFLISSRMDVSSKNVHGYIIGEHGDSSVPVWSSVNVAGVPLLNFIEKEGLESEVEKINQEVVKSAYEIIKFKGYTNWAIGASVADIVHSLIRDEKAIHPVSIIAKGRHGIEHDVFLSLPCVLGRNGVLHIVEQTLTENEVLKLKESAQSLWDVVKNAEL